MSNHFEMVENLLSTVVFLFKFHNISEHTIAQHTISLSTSLQFLIALRTYFIASKVYPSRYGLLIQVTLYSVQKHKALGFKNGENRFDKAKKGFAFSWMFRVLCWTVYKYGWLGFLDEFMNFKGTFEEPRYQGISSYMLFK